jgi:hypothetical protein
MFKRIATLALMATLGACAQPAQQTRTVYVPVPSYAPAYTPTYVPVPTAGYSSDDADDVQDRLDDIESRIDDIETNQMMRDDD